MTEKEYLKLPDRKKDALVAEHVFSAEVQGMANFDGTVNWRYKLRYKGLSADLPLPRFTEDVNAAWGILEKFKGFEMHRYQFYLDGIYKCVLYTDNERFYSEAGTASEAICLTSLIAMKFIKD